MSGWDAAIKPNTKLLFVESPSNPLAELVDIAALAEVAHAKGAMLVVDNCFCTPALQQPLKWGADIVVHSATKFIDGQGRCMGGVVAGRSEQMKEVVGFLRTAGPTLSPFNAWIFLKGLETLNLRMERHTENAIKIAEYLKQHPKVKWVNYAGLKDHPQHDLAQKYVKGKPSAILSFGVQDGLEGGTRFIDALQLFTRLVNIGDAKSLACHPATTTHRQLNAEELKSAGVSEDLVRLSIGIEHIDDLIADLEQALAQV